MAEPRSPRTEASALVGADYDVRVLEPSPPANDDPEWFADDPVNAPGDGRPVVSPITNADRTWADLVSDRPELASFAAGHWLAAYRRLPPLPQGFGDTRLALHRVGAYLASPARRQSNGKIALRFTRGGFGTPFFGADEQVRIEGAELIVQRGDNVRSAEISSLSAAADLVGISPDVDWASEFDVPVPGPLDADLGVKPAAAVVLGDWFGLAWSVLEELRAETASVEASRPQLWPEHFDPAIEIGNAEAHQRASYGFSPGDVNRDGTAGPEPDPYIYVGPWSPDDRPDDDYWNAAGFPGAMLAYADLAGAEDQRQAALSFLRKGRDLLLGHR